LLFSHVSNIAQLATTSRESRILTFTETTESYCLLA
jgi:hypothetical protein